MNTGRQILALEADSGIFQEVLKPLQIAPAPEVLDATMEDDEEPLPDMEQIDLCK